MMKKINEYKTYQKAQDFQYCNIDALAWKAP